MSSQTAPFLCRFLAVYLTEMCPYDTRMWCLRVACRWLFRTCRSVLRGALDHLHARRRDGAGRPGEPPAVQGQQEDSGSARPHRDHPQRRRLRKPAGRGPRGPDSTPRREAKSEARDQARLARISAFLARGMPKDQSCESDLASPLLRQLVVMSQHLAAAASKWKQELSSDVRVGGMAGMIKQTPHHRQSEISKVDRRGHHTCLLSGRCSS